MLTALRYYAVGGFQDVIGAGHGVHKSTVSRCIHRVSQAICRHDNEYIRFPHTAEERREVMGKYYKLCGFPRVLGAVDGTLIHIKGPATAEHIYVCRKGYHALNIQVVCDSELVFRDVVVKYAGGAHDSFIWNRCSLAEKFRNGEFGDAWLLGDSG